MSSVFFCRGLAVITLGSVAATGGRVFGEAVEGNLLGVTPYSTIFDREFTGTPPTSTFGQVMASSVLFCIGDQSTGIDKCAYICSQPNAG